MSEIIKHSKVIREAIFQNKNIWSRVQKVHFLSGIEGVIAEPVPGYTALAEGRGKVMYAI